MLGPIVLGSCEVLSAILMVQTCHSIKPLDLGKWGELYGQCDGTVRAVQAHEKQMEDHCLYRAGMVVHTER